MFINQPSCELGVYSKVISKGASAICQSVCRTVPYTNAFLNTQMCLEQRSNCAQPVISGGQKSPLTERVMPVCTSSAQNMLHNPINGNIIHGALECFLTSKCEFALNGKKIH